jgi:uncharacterized protein (DUF4415 family)
MSAGNTTRISLTAALKASGNTDWARLEREALQEAEPTAEDEFDWAKAELLRRPGKQAVSLRIDDDLLVYFKATGKGYQTRINAVLRAFVEAQKKRDGAPGAAPLDH